MSQRAFQEALARLVVEADFRARVRAEGPRALGRDLTERERERLVALVGSRGLDFTRTLHENFRLVKLYSMLPLTRALLRPERLQKEIESYWSANLPVSHYFLEEAIGFCDHLLRRTRSGGLRVKYLEEVVSFERANLELRRPVLPGDKAPPAQVVRFRHDPEVLFTRLLDKRRPRAVAPRPCTLVGTLDADGEIQWELQQEEGARGRGRKQASARSNTKSAPRDFYG